MQSDVALSSATGRDTSPAVITVPLSVLVAVGIVLAIVVGAVAVEVLRSPRQSKRGRDRQHGSKGAKTPGRGSAVVHSSRDEGRDPQLREHAEKLLNGLAHKLPFDTQNIQIDTVNEHTVYTIDGNTYQSIDEIPDPQTRQNVRELCAHMAEMTKSKPAGSEARATEYTVRAKLEVSPHAKPLDEQTLSFLGTTVARSIRLERANGKIRFVIDGVGYDGLDAIPDANLRQQAQNALEASAHLLFPPDR